MGSSFIAPIAGMANAVSRLDSAASRISRAGVTRGDAGDQVDLSAEVLALMESRTSFAANVKMVQAADEMERSTLSILG